MPVKQEGLKIEYISIKEISKWPRNPKIHGDLRPSFQRFGFIVPMVLDEGTKKLVAGHGRLEWLEDLQKKGEEAPQGIRVEEDGSWLAPVVKGVYFETEEDAEAFLISDNLLASYGWDFPDLKEILNEGIEVFGVENLGDIDFGTDNLDDLDNLEDDDLESTPPVVQPPNDKPKEVEAEVEKKLSDQQIYDQKESNLDKVISLVEEIYFHPVDDDFSKDCIAEVINDNIVTGINRWGIPNLRPDSLVEELPKNLKTWGDRFATPDDGSSWYLFNYGAVKHKGIPFDRTIYSFFSHDDYIESWWMNPAYRVGQMIVAGSRMAIVPDFSLWDFAPTVLKMMSVYRAAWLGRYFQETEMIKVIPRLEYFMEDAKIFSLAGIPIEAPVLATQMQTAFEEDRIPAFQKNLETAINKIFKPKQLLVVASKKGKEILNNTSLNCEVVVLDTAASVRKSDREVETNPQLLELRRTGRRGMKEGSKITTPNQ